MVVMLLLLLCDVDRDEIVSEYMMSASCMSSWRQYGNDALDAHLQTPQVRYTLEFQCPRTSKFKQNLLCGRRNVIFHSPRTSHDAETDAAAIYYPLLVCTCMVMVGCISQYHCLCRCFLSRGSTSTLQWSTYFRIIVVFKSISSRAV